MITTNKNSSGSNSSKNKTKTNKISKNNHDNNNNNENDDNNNNENNIENNNIESDDESDVLKAIKLVPKSLFWDRVSTGHERADSLVREVLAQFIVCQPIKHTVTPPTQTQLSVQTNVQDGSGHYNKKIQNNNSISNNNKNDNNNNNSNSNNNNSTTDNNSSSTDNTLCPYSPSVPIVQIFGAYETVDCFALELELMQPTGTYVSTVERT